MDRSRRSGLAQADQRSLGAIPAAVSIRKCQSARRFGCLRDQTVILVVGEEQLSAGRYRGDSRIEWWEFKLNTRRLNGSPPTPLFQELEHPVIGVKIVLDVHPRPEVVRDVHQFPPSANRHEHHSCLLDHGQLGDGDRVRQPFERAA